MLFIVQWTSSTYDFVCECCRLILCFLLARSVIYKYNMTWRIYSLSCLGGVNPRWQAFSFRWLFIDTSTLKVEYVTSYSSRGQDLLSGRELFESQSLTLVVVGLWWQTAFGHAEDDAKHFLRRKCAPRAAKVYLWSMMSSLNDGKGKWEYLVLSFKQKYARKLTFFGNNINIHPADFIWVVAPLFRFISLEVLCFSQIFFLGGRLTNVLPATGNKSYFPFFCFFVLLGSTNREK